MNYTGTLLEGFQTQKVPVGDVRLHVATGGEGPPILLLHGFPESHDAWHSVAPLLAERFTVVAPDLRGYGQSDKPEGDPGHQAYAKRTMARDVLELMRHLGHDRFAVAGHDRGGLVGVRLALDHPEAVERLTVMDVMPATDTWQFMNGLFGLSGHHMYLLAQPSDYPERLIGAAPEVFLDQMLAWTRVPGAITDAARAVYLEAFRDLATIHAIAEDYRAGVSIDLEHEAHDRARGTRIQAPVQILTQDVTGFDLSFDPLEVYRGWADNVTAATVPTGHFLPEEAPAEVAKAIERF